MKNAVSYMWDVTVLLHLAFPSLPQLLSAKIVSHFFTICIGYFKRTCGGGAWNEFDPDA